MLSLIASALVALAGLWLALVHEGSPTTQSYGWVLAAFGVLFLLANVALRWRGGARRR